ncbi:MAG: IS21 family transposase, partial [Polyangia bacterium]
MDRPALKPLPKKRYEYGEWSEPKVNIDYHVEVDKHFYSVPYQLVGEQVEARRSATTVEIIF